MAKTLVNWSSFGAVKLTSKVKQGSCFRHHDHHHRAYINTLARLPFTASCNFNTIIQQQAIQSDLRNNKYSLSKVHRLQQINAQVRKSSTMSSSNLYTSETPEVISSAKGIHLITQSTPNGQKVQIFLEELKEKYGTEFTFNTINIGTNEQKKDYFLRIDPNGRIPVIVDNTVSPPHAVHETSAELVYLQSKYDKENAFGFTDPIEVSELFTWLFFWHGRSFSGFSPFLDSV